MSETTNLENELKLLNKPKTTIEHLDCLADYFVVQGLFSDDVMLKSLSQIMELEKAMIKIKKVLRSFASLVAECERKSESSLKRAETLHKMLFEYESRSSAIFQANADQWSYPKNDRVIT